MRVRRWALCTGLLLQTALIAAAAGRKGIVVPKRSGPAVISTATPTDSRGETVYEFQEKESGDRPVVPGTLVGPTLLKWKAPAYPKEYKKERKEGHIVVEAVLTPDGLVIDTKPSEGSDELFARSAVESVSQYHFAPATLDGKPVALRVKIDVQFKIF